MTMTTTNMVRRRPLPVILPAASRGRVFAMASGDGIQALSNAFDLHAAETTRAIAAMKATTDALKADAENVSETIAGMQTGLATVSGRDTRGGNPKALAAFGEFVKTGKTDAMAALASPHAAMSVDSDPDGGYTVPVEVGQAIIDRQRDTSPMRRLATVRTVYSDSYDQLLNAGGGSAAWVGEREERPTTLGPGFKNLSYPAHEIYANVGVTQKLLDDSAFDVSQIVMKTIAEDFDDKEGASFISGDGVKKPRGFLAGPAPVTTADASRQFGVLQYVATGSSTGFDTDDAPTKPADCLIDLVYALKAGHRRNARWLMNSKTAGGVRKLKDSTGDYLWQQSIILGQPSTLLGYPVEFDEGMPDIGSNAFPIAFGDFERGYLITDRVGIRVLRDPYTAKPYVLFYVTKRVGGGLLDSNAIKLLKVAVS